MGLQNRNCLAIVMLCQILFGFAPGEARADGPTAQDLQQRFKTSAEPGNGVFASVTAATITGDISKASVRIGPSATARALSDRLAIYDDVKDFGAVGDGVTDDTAAIQAAEEAARQAPAGGQLILVSPGNYVVNQTIYSTSNNVWLIPSGAQFQGPGVITGSLDSNMLQGGTGLSLLKLSNGVVGTGLFVSNLDQNSSGGIGYEKNGIVARIRQADPSSNSDGSYVNRDFVAAVAIADIATGNLSGRVWGGDNVISVPSGADGYAVGLEIGINNFATIGPLGFPHAKIGINLFASGSVNSTAAVNIANAGASWTDGVVIAQNSVAVDAVALRAQNVDVAAIHKDGSATFTNIASTGSIVAGGVLQLAQYKVKTLPTGCSPGQEVFASDGLNAGETSGNGTGTPVFCKTSGGWYSFYSSQLVQN